MPAEPTSPLSTEASPHAMIQRYELGFAPGGATRAVSETALPGVVRWSTPTSSVGAGGGGRGPSLALHVAAHTASVATAATIATRSYGTSSLPDRSMTRAGARVGAGRPRRRDELPGIRAVGEGELQHAERAAHVHLAIGRDHRIGGIEAIAPGADDERSEEHTSELQS